MGDIQVIKSILKDLPNFGAFCLLLYILFRDGLKYLKNRDTITGKTDVAKIELEKENEITSRTAQNELFTLFREQHKFNLKKGDNDEEYHKNALDAQYQMIGAVKELSDKIMLPEEHIIQAILLKLHEMQIDFFRYHDIQQKELV